MLSINQSAQLDISQQNNAFSSPLMNSANTSPSVCKCGAIHHTQQDASQPRSQEQPRHHEPKDKDVVPSNNFGKLIEELKQVLGPNHGLSSEDIDIEKVKHVMESYQSDESEWSQFALHDKSRPYTRNGVVDINGNANLLILVWSPSKSSAIHDHANAHCCMKILKGTLKESLYDIPTQVGNELSPKCETLLHREDVGYISDDIGLHKISNPSQSDYAVSLHLYTPPYASMYGCCTYEAGNGKKHHVDMSKYYSWQGKLVDSKESSTC